jgi:hypothetical protein
MSSDDLPDAIAQSIEFLAGKIIPKPIQKWCDENGYSDPQAVEQHGGRKTWYGFPLGAVMPAPLFVEWWGGFEPVDRDLAVRVAAATGCSVGDVEEGLRQMINACGSSSSLEVLGTTRWDAAANTTPFSDCVAMSRPRGSWIRVSIPAVFDEFTPSLNPLEEMTTIVSRRARVVNVIAGFRVRDFMIREQLSAETLLDYWQKGMVKMTHGRLCRGKKFPKRAGNYGRDGA